MEKNNMTEIIQLLLNLVNDYGYLGAFIGSLLGNITIALPTPYALLVAALGTNLNPFILGIVSGLGSTIGEVVSYFVGYAGRKIMNEQQKERLEIVKRLLEKYGFLTIILFAVTPLPDDLILVPMGMMRFDLKTLVFTVWIGKTILALFLAYIGYYSVDYFDFLFQSSGFTGIIISMVLLFGIVIVLLKFNWETILDRF